MENDMIYRYIPFEAFVQLVTKSELPFVNPLECWPDKFEGYLFRKLNKEYPDETSQKAFIYVLQSFIPDEDPEKIKKMVLKTQAVRCECWSYNDDKVVMWNSYPYNHHAIMVGTTKKEMDRLPVKIRNVTYVASMSLASEVTDVVSVKGIQEERVFTRKRKEFDYENEVRYFVKKEYLQTLAEPLSNVIMLPVSDIQSFIKKVIVHPEAEGWFVDTVQSFCNNNHIAFNGKSKLYDLD